MRVTDFIDAILIGAVVGLLGRLVLPGRQRIGVFATFLIGVGASLLGMVIAHALAVDRATPAHFWFLRWDWVVLSIQVALAVIGVGVANMMTYTRLAGGDKPRRRAPRKRRTTSRSSA
ncbi:MAG TPA: GlsB/YeaQ/YmgE family stress response membrane protein [Micromonosporaceae bacterium]|jgi:uncharacterized membrane protein YeaQ/YmgE (transglycosylase-associated protein family)